MLGDNPLRVFIVPDNRLLGEPERLVGIDPTVLVDVRPGFGERCCPEPAERHGVGFVAVLGRRDHRSPLRLQNFDGGTARAGCQHDELALGRQAREPLGQVVGRRILPRNVEPVVFAVVAPVADQHDHDRLLCRALLMRPERVPDPVAPSIRAEKQCHASGEAFHRVGRRLGVLDKRRRIDRLATQARDDHHVRRGRCHGGQHRQHAGHQPGQSRSRAAKTNAERHQMPPQNRRRDHSMHFSSTRTM